MACIEKILKKERTLKKLIFSKALMKYGKDING